MTDNAAAALLSTRINALLEQHKTRDRLTALVSSFAVEISMIPLNDGSTRAEITDELLALVKDAVMHLEDVN